MADDKLQSYFSDGHTPMPDNGDAFSRSVGRMAKIFSASIWQDYRETVLSDTPAYIGTSPMKNLGRMGYLSVIQLVAMLISYTNLKYFSLFFEIYYLFGVYCCYVIWKRSGYSKVLFIFLNTVIVAFEALIVFHIL